MSDTLLGEHSGVPAVEVTCAQAPRLSHELAAAWDFAQGAARIPADAPNWWRLVYKGRYSPPGARARGSASAPASVS
ncbi:hypothetical protein [Caldimonas tepidiphila]|uniref:hypothetical protein n=1 Tax=Caldimonas tepidiphila TaxID=2315841 RepID=UPI001300A8A8|nr:hypothetical protein [Caldimonas tepidiphila]